ncbi:Leucine Rich Repeat [Seminavis robusta]|uniref:Leucine Rich Repeat n=1 Tax=Seminavis robusta TaxID=568900 RepID=A0A9N8H930_9STRA|nr:Leucine Rich Repeat [Seminavis robusta]|eukprot:Sro106_g053440.1 Leucine Rich Repeat (667) ;mRNA; r:15046-17046
MPKATQGNEDDKEEGFNLADIADLEAQRDRWNTLAVVGEGGSEEESAQTAAEDDGQLESPRLPMEQGKEVQAAKNMKADTVTTKAAPLDQTSQLKANTKEPTSQQQQQGRTLTEPPNPGTNLIPGAYAMAPTGTGSTNGEENDLPTEADNATAPGLDDNGLAVANPVEEALPHHQLPQAHNLDAAQQAARRRQQETKEFKILVLFGTLLLIATIVITLTVLVQRKEPMALSLQVPTPSPSTAVNSTAEAGLRFSFLEEDPDTLQALQNPGSPQSRAYQWLLDDVLANLTSYSEDRIKQRFALATFFYSTNGHNWTSQIRLLSNPKNGTSPSPDDYFRPEESLAWYGTAPANKSTPSSAPQGAQQQAHPYEPWLSSHHECSWWSLAHINGFSTCRSNDSAYVSLDLEGNNLAGQLPPELGLLTTLEGIHLGGIDLRGRDSPLNGTIFSQIGQLTNLRELDLGLAHFSGTLPTELALLSNSLQYLAVMRNQLSGSFPSQLLALSKLEQLKMGYNKFEGTIPGNIGTKLSNLHVFTTPGNNLHGTILSSLMQCSNLTFIDVAENQFMEELPSELGTLTHLTRLFLPNNRFHGAIPSELALLPKLAKLNLHNNADLTGSLPSEFSTLNSSLSVLQIQGTRVTGTIPDALCSINKLKFDCSETLCGCDCPC